MQFWIFYVGRCTNIVDSGSLLNRSVVKGLPPRRDSFGRKNNTNSDSKINITFLKLNILCSNFEDRSGWIWNARIRCLFVQKYLGGVPDKKFDHRFLTPWNLGCFWTKHTGIERFRNCSPEILRKNIEFEIHYGRKNWKSGWKWKIWFENQKNQSTAVTPWRTRKYFEHTKTVPVGVSPTQDLSAVQIWASNSKYSWSYDFCTRLKARWFRHNLCRTWHTNSGLWVKGCTFGRKF